MEHTEMAALLENEKKLLNEKEKEIKEKEMTEKEETIDQVTTKEVSLIESTGQLVAAFS